MKYLVIMLLLCSIVMGSTSVSPMRGRYPNGPLMRGWEEVSNSMVIGDADNPETEYDKLISRGDMGTISSTNRRTLFLLPGTYTRTAVWTLDTEYVDIVGLGASPDDVIVTSASGSTVKQTAADVRLSNFTIKSTGTTNGETTGSGGSCGFELAAADNSASQYDTMYFVGTSVGTQTGFPVYGTENINGTWTNCHATGFAWRVAENKQTNGTFHNCISWYQYIKVFNSTYGYGYQSFAGDEAGVDCSGKFYRCISGQGSFGGCDSFGANCSGLFIDCQSGQSSFALQRIFSGTAIRCLTGVNSFAAGTSNGGINAKFSGKAIDCIISGKGSLGLESPFADTYYSFAQGSPSGGIGTSDGITEGAIIENCRVGFSVDLQNGKSAGHLNKVATTTAYSTLTTAFAAAGNTADITITSKYPGSWFNNWYLRISTGGLPTNFAVSLDFSLRKIVVLIGSSVDKTGTQLKALLDANTDFAGLFTCTLVGDGSGNIDKTYAEQYLTGGLAPVVIKGCKPPVPTRCTAATTVKFLDNGQTYTNAGATGAVTITLPAAVPGYSYTFWDVDNTATVDLTIEGDASEEIGALGTAAVADDDAIQFITVKCVVAGSWQVEGSSGTWD